MKHAREDYNRIQDPEGKIPEDEPVFLIRGQDALGPTTLRLYADLCSLMDVDPRITEAVYQQAMDMDQWQIDKGIIGKLPDLPKEETFMNR